mmetsp:Transcript_31697/g.43487  ORF Transcript_31697/g.43487 Transcript_31697/m.43487 type:complete len:235 (-) Transcript_31697:113-817(-)
MSSSSGGSSWIDNLTNDRSGGRWLLLRIIFSMVRRIKGRNRFNRWRHHPYMMTVVVWWGIAMMVLVKMFWRRGIEVMLLVLEIMVLKFSRRRRFRQWFNKITSFMILLLLLLLLKLIRPAPSVISGRIILAHWVKRRTNGNLLDNSRFILRAVTLIISLNQMRDQTIKRGVRRLRIFAQKHGKSIILLWEPISSWVNELIFIEFLRWRKVGLTRWIHVHHWFFSREIVRITKLT